MAGDGKMIRDPGGSTVSRDGRHTGIRIVIALLIAAIALLILLNLYLLFSVL
jgi:hypothetical protein